MKQLRLGTKIDDSALDEPPEPVFTLSAFLTFGHCLLAGAGCFWFGIVLLTEKDDLPVRVVVMVFGLFWFGIVGWGIYKRWSDVRQYHRRMVRLKAITDDTARD